MLGGVGACRPLRAASVQQPIRHHATSAITAPRRSCIPRGHTVRPSMLFAGPHETCASHCATLRGTTPALQSQRAALWNRRKSDPRAYLARQRRGKTRPGSVSWRPRGHRGLSVAGAPLPFVDAAAVRLIVAFHPNVLTPVATPAWRSAMGAVREQGRALQALWRRAISVPKEHPLAFAVSLSTVKMAAVDYVVQKYVEGRQHVDMRRVAAFGCFGALYCGVWQYALYSCWFPRAFPAARAFASQSWRAKLANRAGMRALLGQLVCDQLINTPLVYFPIFYVIQGAVVHGNSADASMSEYRSNFSDDMRSALSVWVPVQAINFTLSPLWFRTPFVMAVGLAWTGVLSHRRGGGHGGGNDIKPLEPREH